MTYAYIIYCPLLLIFHLPIPRFLFTYNIL